MPRRAREKAVKAVLTVPGAERPAPRSPPCFEPRFFSRLAAIEAIHFWFAARRNALTPLLTQVTAGLSPGYRVLEVGCGTGGSLGLLREVCRDGRVLGLDLELSGLAFARGRTAAGLLQADLTRPPFGQEFAVICLFDVLEHIPEEKLVLRNLFHLLAKGGSLLLTVPASPALWSYFDVAVHHQRRYRTAELAGKLAAAGFEVEYLTPYMAALLPLVYLQRTWSSQYARLRPRALRHEYDRALDDLAAPPPWANRLAALLLAFEPTLVAHRLPLPTGTSLLALARRPR